MLHAYLVKVSSLVNEAIGEVLDFSLWKNLTHKKSIKNKQTTFTQLFLYA